MPELAAIYLSIKQKKGTLKANLFLVYFFGVGFSMIFIPTLIWGLI